MHNLFDPADVASILGRLAKLPSGGVRQWGKMTSGQMLAHCSAALQVATGETSRNQSFVGKVLAPFVKGSVLGEKPFPHNSPTDPTFVMTGEKDFEAEKARLTELITRFSQRGPERTSGTMHSFFGRLTGEQWGVLMYKHLDHHLSQFSG